jgi:CBS domain-containing protein
MGRKKKMQAKDIMSSPVVTVTPDASVTEVATLLLEKRISGVPVVDQAGQIAGIISEGDLLRRVETGTERHRPHWLEMLLGRSGDAGSFIKSHASRVGDVMSHDVIATHPEASLREVAELMERHGIKRVPIVDGGRLVGIVSRANLVQGLLADRKSTGGQTDDDQIRAKLTDLLRTQPWIDHNRINIVVSGGTVQLWGAVRDDEQRRALTVAAESIAGVRSVEDHLTANTFTNDAG